MADYRFTLRLDLPKKYPKYNGRNRHYLSRRDAYKCGNSDGLDNCTCMGQYGKTQEECSFYGRPIEPLAFYLNPSEVVQQAQCPLYTALPKEIRDLIFEYALTADDAYSYGSKLNLFTARYNAEYIHNPEDGPTHNIACALLQTCKVVYLECYRLPVQLNGYVSREGPTGHGTVYRPHLRHITPWQYALIQRLDIGTQQVALEDGNLKFQLLKWSPSLRHSGAYVAPHFYNGGTHQRTPGVIPAHNFGLTTFGEDTPGWRPEDGDEVRLREACYVHDFHEEIGHFYREGKVDFIARGMVARPLTHLIIRMSRTDWWTWTDIPSETDSDKQLALDPSRGNVGRPLLTDMLALAAERRNGRHPQYEEGTWGAAIGMLPDLRTFELVLETFWEKKRQLEVVVDCAKTWKFPLADTRCELVCDGNVEALNWTYDEGGWETESDGEESDNGSEAEQEDDNDAQMDMETEFQPNEDSAEVNPDLSPSEASNQHGGDASNSRVHRDSPPPPLSLITVFDTVNAEPDPSIPNQELESGDLPMSPWSDRDNNGYTACSRPTSPYSPASSQLSSPHYSPTSPVFSPTPPNWYDSYTEFEVRVVRFRRRQME